MDFVAIELKTANPKLVSACCIGITKVANGKVERSYCHVFKPVDGHTSCHTKLHGLTTWDTECKPEFPQVYRELIDCLGASLFVGSRFTKRVLGALERYYMERYYDEFIDIASAARCLAPIFGDQKLRMVASSYLSGNLNRHNALVHSRLCAEVFMQLHGLGSAQTIDQILDSGLAPPDAA